MKIYTNKWIYVDTHQCVETKDINGYYGFVYMITNLKNGKRYVGRKYFWQFRKPKGKKRKEKKESDWKFYYGSSKALLEDVKKYGQDKFYREILSFHTTKGSTNYSETKELFKKNVLENEQYYNDNILGRYYHSVLEKKEK